MNNLRRILAVALLLCVALGMCACEQSDPTDTGSTPASGSSGPASSGTTTVPSSTSDGKVDYTVLVVDPDGNPVEGARVQVCYGEKCYTPVKTDANGVATFRLEPLDGYKTKLTKAIEGYVHADYIYFESGATSITIQLVAETGSEAG